MRFSVKILCLSILLVPSAVQAQQSVMWGTFGGGGTGQLFRKDARHGDLLHKMMPGNNLRPGYLRYPDPIAFHWSLGGMDASLNYLRRGILHRLDFNERHDGLATEGGIFALREISRFYMASYTVGVGLSRRFYILGLSAGPALLWGNGEEIRRIYEYEGRNIWPFVGTALTLRVSAQAYFMPLKFFGFGLGASLLPLYNPQQVAGLTASLVVRNSWK